MEEISEINVNDIDYSLCDETARSDATAALTTLSKEILYYYQQVVSSATSAEIMRITDSRITTDTVVLDCTFADPANITTDVDWTSYAGYIVFTGTCTAATTANVTLGTKNN